MTRAEKRALEAYPVRTYRKDQGEPEYSSDYNANDRYRFQEGYEQAEKDLIGWIEEQLTILDKQTLLHPDDDVFWGQRNAYKQMKDKLNSL